MLIRWAVMTDLNTWSVLADAVSKQFDHSSQKGQDPDFLAFAKQKIDQHEALTAVDYRSGQCMGFLAFSRQNNRISWFAVSEEYRQRGVGTKLLKTALRQLDTAKPITVTAFPSSDPDEQAARHLYRKFGFSIEKNVVYNGLLRAQLTRPSSKDHRGSSFHFRYPEYFRESKQESCPVCNALPAPKDQNDIYENANIWVCGEYPGQGRLFGKLYVMPKKHAVHFEDMPSEDTSIFISEVQRVGRALRSITGAEKINYELYANSGAHLHIHLFPRYLDDDFPSAPIDFRIKDPSPYENYDEYVWFIDRMREELRKDEIPYHD